MKKINKSTHLGATVLALSTYIDKLEADYILKSPADKEDIMRIMQEYRSELIKVNRG